jgi:hypothetical protein
LRYSDGALVALVEFDNFTRFAAKHLSADEVDALKEALSTHPKAGAIIQGTGGVRKLRWAAKGNGKSGGVRVIYYYHDQHMPLLLLTGFAKNEKSDLNEADKNAFKKAIPLLVRHYRRLI